MASIDDGTADTSWRTAALVVAPAVLLAALVVMAVSRFVPLAAAQFYVQGAAAIVALWPLAYVMGTQPVPATAARPASVTTQ